MLDPHDGYEGLLLARGIKPIGLLCPSDPPSFGFSRDFHDEVMEQIRLADEAVARGTLKKKTLEVPAPGAPAGSPGTPAYFYAQPVCEAEMEELAAWYEAQWQSGSGPDLAKKNPGAYFGYTDRDIALSGSGGGGIHKINALQRVLLERTNSVRRLCRIQALMWNL